MTVGTYAVGGCSQSAYPFESSPGTSMSVSVGDDDHTAVSSSRAPRSCRTSADERSGPDSLLVCVESSGRLANTTGGWLPRSGTTTSAPHAGQREPLPATRAGAFSAFPQRHVKRMEFVASPVIPVSMLDVR